MHVLPVRRHDGRHDQRDRDGDLPRPHVRRRAGERQHDEDLVGRVGDRREGVAGEDGQRDPLRQQGFAKLGTAELLAEEDPLGDVADTHERTGYGSTVHVVIMGCGRVGSTLARSLEDRNHTVSIIDSDPDAFRRLGPGVQRRQGDRLRLRAGRPREGRHPSRRRLRGRLERRQLQHHRRACRPGDVRHPAGRGPDLRPRPRRGLPAARHHHGRHGEVDRRPGAPPNPAGGGRARLPRPVRHRPRRPGAGARMSGSATRPTTSRSSPTAGSPGSTGSARACCRPSESVIQEGDLLHLVMREENAAEVFAVITKGPEEH